MFSYQRGGYTTSVQGCQPVMMEQFLEFILNNRNVSAKHIPFYIKWVFSCQEFLLLPLE